MTVESSSTLQALIHSVVQEMMQDEQWPTLRSPLMRQAEVVAYDNSNNLAQIYLGGNRSALLIDVPCLCDYPLVVGNACWALQNGSDVVILGQLGGGGQWVDYNVTFSSSVNPAPTLGTGGTNQCRWFRRGKSVFFSGQLTFGTSAGQPGGEFWVSIPFASANFGGQDYVGNAYCTKVSGTPNLACGIALIPNATSTMGFRLPNTTTIGDLNTLANGVFPLAFASGDTLRWNVCYEAA
jgi:hypothetical protein